MPPVTPSKTFIAGAAILMGGRMTPAQSLRSARRTRPLSIPPFLMSSRTNRGSPARDGARRCSACGSASRLGAHEWPASERPRERLLRAGPASLSDGELLAVLLGTGTRGRSAWVVARSLLEQAGGLPALLGKTPGELARSRGVGPARAARLAAAVELGRRYLEAPADRRSSLHSAGRRGAVLQGAAARLAARSVLLPVPRHPSPPDPLRGAVSRHHRRRHGLSARSGQTRAATQRLGRHRRAQPSVRRVGAERGGSRHHAKARQGTGARGNSPVGPFGRQPRRSRIVGGARLVVTLARPRCALPRTACLGYSPRPLTGPDQGTSDVKGLPSYR